MTFKGKYINGHIELIDEVKAENNSEVEIHFLDEEKVKPLKVTFQKPEDEKEKERKAKANQEFEELRKEISSSWKGKNKDLIISQEDIDENCF